MAEIETVGSSLRETAINLHYNEQACNADLETISRL
jgi:hypothetical protein